MHYKFGLYVHIQHLRPLLTILKAYEKPSLLTMREGENCFVIDAKKPSNVKAPK